MNEDDFLLDEEDEDLDENYVTPEDEDEDSDSDNEYGNSGSDEEEDSRPEPTEQDYNGRMTRDEIYLSSAYDDIVTSAKKNEAKVSTGGGRMFDGNIVDAVRTIIGSAPKNTATMTIENYTKEFFQTQGHNRIPASVYTPDQPLRGGDLDDEFGGSDDAGFNVEYAKEARNQIARFIKFLADRDLSKDTIISKRRKQRQIPAFIIFLFSSGMYDLILNCETLPPEYKVQVDNAFRRIQKQKYDIVEALAQRYESKGRNEVAERVRKMGLDWFSKEPPEIRSLAAYADLNLTYDDVMDYREFRPRFTNASRTITQDLVSDMIEVVIEPNRIYEKLKDKTRTDAISDVKQVYKEWSKENPIDSELASKIIWKDLKLVN